MKLYIGITTSKYFALSTWVLFILLMQSVNGALILNNTALFVSYACRAARSVIDWVDL